MDFNRLNEVLTGEPSFRQKQVKKAVFVDLTAAWDEVSVLPLSLREKLNKECPLQIEALSFSSRDKKTVKAVFTLKDGFKIEAVLMSHQDGRNTVCVSSQVGCALGCLFCATGKMGFKRNLDSFEIVEQVLYFARLLKKKRQRVNNIVFMGMGEPFLNYENVMGAVRILNDKQGFNIGSRRISISTVGILEGIKKLAMEDGQVNLAISLHAPFDQLRSSIVPLNKKNSISQILKEADDYIEKTKRRVMIEYIMIKGLNDSDECAEKLADLFSRRPLYFINLISYNETGEFSPSSPQRMKKFKQILERRGVVVTERYRFGKGIEAACGQLASENKN